MNMFKPTTAKTPDEYIDMVEEPRKTDIKKLDAFIRKLLPNEKRILFGSIIGYGKIHYKGKTREGEWFPVGLASQKNYISVYVCAADGKQYVAEKYKKEFPKASIGKSCIRFKKLGDIDLDVLKKVILEGKKMGFAF